MCCFCKNSVVSEPGKNVKKETVEVTAPSGEEKEEQQQVGEPEIDLRASKTIVGNKLVPYEILAEEQQKQSVPVEATEHQADNEIGYQTGRRLLSDQENDHFERSHEYVGE